MSERPKSPHDLRCFPITAQQEMREKQALQRANAVRADAERKKAQVLLRSTEKHIEHLKAQARFAVDVPEAERLAREITEYEEDVRLRQRQMELATDIVDEAMSSLRREEEWIRQKTADDLSLRAQWKNSGFPGRPVFFPGQAETMQITRFLVIVVVICAALIAMFAG